MLRLVTITLLVFAFYGCGDGIPATQPAYFMDPAYLDNYRQFMSDATDYHVTISYPNVRIFRVSEIANAEPGQVGQCQEVMAYKNVPITNRQYGEVRWKEVTIIPEILDNPLILKYTIYHEFGHCFGDLEHSPDPNSIMFWSFSGNESLESWSQKVKGLFESMGGHKDVSQ